MSLLENATLWLAQNDEHSIFQLNNENGYLTLFKTDEPKLGGIAVDFVGGALAHRRRFGGGVVKRLLRRLVLKAIIYQRYLMPRQDWVVMPLS